MSMRWLGRKRPHFDQDKWRMPTPKVDVERLIESAGEMFQRKHLHVSLPVVRWLVVRMSPRNGSNFRVPPVKR